MTITRFTSTLLIILMTTFAVIVNSQKGGECLADDKGQCQNTEQVDIEGSRDDNGDEYDYDNDNVDSDYDNDDDIDVWETGTIGEITEYLDCEWISKEVHQQQAWSTFNRVYNEKIGKEKSSIPGTYETNGFQIPVEIKYSEDVGRGVFSIVDIKKGDLIYISTNNAQFETAQEYRNFLKGLPQNFACEIIIWAFSRMVSAEKEEEFIACVDLDEGSFVNTAHHKNPKCNMELGTKDGLLEEGNDETVTWYGCDLKFYARRDIKADEEIRADYGDFAEPHGWAAMGLA
eukprot:CAMPEP_0170797790 /NCGR_PEP_ID=MMETSP0733-20121128/25856_1 /TAXON_ID=186038 /ORGANISM="Fragilariopsis kerguelensis, Strain L26-C5" /LENGTH=287 /DNA_ID=CAMNT_0011148791 /DNA_START=175 /DNA_END=1038 /DNA_ORIENTATION=-